ncbi:MAG: redoxin domain-containing protein [Alphaproteobacteria bacterium]|nr:redoxin domain-containing protein [Alphaproteobacteria bacterium]
MKYLIHSDCPDFTAAAIMPGGKFNGGFNLAEYIKGKLAVLLFYPLDFNYVSAMELRSVQKRIKQFEDAGAVVIGISCDSHLAHQTWVNLPPAAGGVGPLGFPLVSDITRGICRSFDLLVADAIAESSSVIVDRSGQVVFQSRTDTAIARNVDRLIKAVQLLDDAKAPEASAAEQIIKLEENAEALRAAGMHIIAQSVDSGLDDPAWDALWKKYPRGADGQPGLSFPFFANKREWTNTPGLTLVLREGARGHGTGLLGPDGQMLMEFHSARHVPRDFDEVIRLAHAARRHIDTGEVVLWEAAA